MRILELFSGTGSIGEAFQKEDWEVVSLDVSKTGGATICCDFMVWDFKTLPPGHFDAIWASPVCTHYSCARTKAGTPRDFEWADGLVLKTLEIIEYFNPPCLVHRKPTIGIAKDTPLHGKQKLHRC